MQLVESLEKIVFPMRFTDKLNSVSNFCLQFEWTTRSAIFGVSCSKFVRRKPFFAILGQLNHRLYLGESFLKYILFNSKLEVFSLIPEILN